MHLGLLGTPGDSWWLLWITSDYCGSLVDSWGHLGLLGTHGESWGLLVTTLDYWWLLGTTWDYWVLLVTTVGYWGLLGDTWGTPGCPWGSWWLLVAPGDY